MYLKLNLLEKKNKILIHIIYDSRLKIGVDP